MPYPTIEEQLEAMKRNSARILKSKKACEEFLIRIGVIKEGKVKKLPKKKKIVGA